MTVDGSVSRLRVGHATYDLEPWSSPIVIGRELPAHVLVDHPLVSRRHAELVFDGLWQVRDLGSTNGTWRNGLRLQAAELHEGDEVRLGDPTTGVVLAVESAAPAGHPAGETVLRPSRQSSRGNFDEHIVVGRDPQAHVHVDDPVASWHHAELLPTGTSGWTIVDLGSTNQTLVNGVPVTTRPLAVDDVVLIGNTRLRWSGSTLEAAAESGFVVDNASWEVKGKKIVNSISFAMRTSSLVAVIGPSGAGKSSLMRLITGQTRPSQGVVSLDGATLASQRSAHRGQIGVVPQYTVAHQTLTARHVLSNAARLRLPADTRRAELDRVVATSLDQMGLTEHADTRMARLSGGQQRRVGIAMEMLTSPTLLVLDEPTAGLDPSLVLQIMQTLRQLADSGTKVVLVTHDLDHLALADQVLVLRAGGTLAYSGPPDGIFEHFGTGSWAETFTRLSAPEVGGEPSGERSTRSTGVQPVELPVPPISLATAARHLAVVAARQVRVVATDAVYLALMVTMPLALALLTLAIPGGDGLGQSSDPASAEASRLLVILVVGAAFLGLSATVRDLVAEQPIFLHERDAGLVPSAYLMAKLVVFTVVAVLQAVLLTVLVLATRAAPKTPVLLPSAAVELAAAVSLTAMAGVALGLAVGSRVRTSEQSMPPLVLLVMAQLVLCGGMFPVDEGGVLPVLSGVMPTRWGYALAASTTDLNAVSAAVDPDSLWTHSASNWMGGALVLISMWCAFALVAFTGLRRRPAA